MPSGAASRTAARRAVVWCYTEGLGRRFAFDYGSCSAATVGGNSHRSVRIAKADWELLRQRLCL